MDFKKIAAAAVCVLLPASALAANFDQIVAFGDSLSDAGNGSPGGNYATRDIPDGAGGSVTVSYYTDGTTTSPSTSTVGLWVDQLAGGLGVADPLPALGPTGGTNYAVAGATTLAMQGEVDYFLGQNPTPSAASLYTFWGGANDLRDDQNTTDAKQSADNIYSQIQELAAAGGKNILWLNLPALGSTPDGSGNAAALNAATDAFNAEWSVDLADLHAQGISAVGVDVHSLFNQILANPSAYGFTNTTDAAQDLDVNPDQYVFWDGLHPTTSADTLVANLALADVPEPATGALMLLGGCGLLARRRSSKCR